MYKKYKPEFDYSYTLGYATTLDLLRYQPQTVLRVAVRTGNDSNPTVQEIKNMCRQYNIEYIINDNQIDRLSLKENCYVVGFFQKYPQELTTTANHIMLVNPSDMGNLGTIMRTMLGFDQTNLAIIKPACDDWAPKVIRGSMGARFQVNIQHYNSLDAYVNQHPHYHLYPFMLNANQDLRSLAPQLPYTLIFGNEGSGLPEEYSRVGESVIIKHSSKIDSLNLGVSVSLALYQTAKLI